jgi:hypothetical protein
MPQTFPLHGQTFTVTGSPSPHPAAFIDQVVSNEIEGEAILQTFREEMEPQFPFVVIGTSSGFEQLKDERPLLLLAVVMVGLRHDQTRQEIVARRIREIIGQDILTSSQQNFDLLQCLLVYINWSVKSL